MTISGISTNVQTILESLDWLVTVLPHPPTKDSDFAGYPSVAHYYADTETNYATVTQDRRRIEYVIELYFVTNTNTTAADEFSQMYTHVDNLLTAFDTRRDLADASLSLARVCDLARPVPAQMERITTAEGDGLMATIRLICEADISVSYS